MPSFTGLFSPLFKKNNTPAENPIEEVTYSTSGKLGARIVSDPKDAAFDLWFIHGLTGNRETTWTHSNKTFWPLLLKDAFPQARIIVYGYDADVVGLWTNASSETLLGYGNTLAISIANTRLQGEDRPVYAICHSLGGLVFEAACLACLQPSTPRLHPIPSKVAGVLFMGTPHQGSWLASWGTPVAKMLNTIWRSNHQLLKVLQRGSSFLVQVEENFQTHLVHNWTHIKIICFYENIAVKSVGFVVPKESATLLAYTKCGIDGTHMSMTKFSGPQDANYMLVKSQLVAWTASATSSPDHPQTNTPQTDPLQQSSTETGVSRDQSTTTEEQSTMAGEQSTARQPQTGTQTGIHQAGSNYHGAVTATKVVNGNINAYTISF